MIHHAFTLLRNELKSYFTSLNDPVDVVVDNVGLLETQHADNLNDSVILSLVNIEEESTLKNGRNVFASGSERMVRYVNTPVHLNLYVLVTANFPGGTPPNNGYALALAKLSSVIRFFQSRNYFTVDTLSQPFPGVEDPSLDPNILNLRLTMELYTLTFEQINHLWGSLGGRQIPFALYKLRLVAITERSTVREIPLIEEIESKLVTVNDNC